MSPAFIFEGLRYQGGCKKIPGTCLPRWFFRHSQPALCPLAAAGFSFFFGAAIVGPLLRRSALLLLVFNLAGKAFLVSPAFLGAGSDPGR